MSTYGAYRSLLAEGAAERLVFFSDAVFAIAMTLLIVELRVPDVAGPDLGTALAGLVPGYLTFVLSFVVVGMVWMSHHRKFRVIVRADSNVVRMNLLLLLFVASIPLPTGILGTYGDDALSVCVYAVEIGLVGFQLSAIWVYAWHRRLVDPVMTTDVYRFVLVQSVIVPGVFLLSVPVALLLGPTVAECSWAIAVPATVLVPRLSGTRAAGARGARTAQ